MVVVNAISDESIRGSIRKRLSAVVMVEEGGGASRELSDVAREVWPSKD